METPDRGPLDLDACQAGRTHRITGIQTTALPEASALVASQKWPGVYWTLNDSHNEPTLYAFDQSGHSRGAFNVGNAENVDWEALQLGPGRDGGRALYVGDTGDNHEKRHDAVIYRVPEPQPTSADEKSGDAKSGLSRSISAEAFRFVFPDGPHNTEAMLVHPKTGEILLITKESRGHSAVYRMPLPLDSRHAVTLEWIAAIDVANGHPDRDLITDASISADARHVIVRTYSRSLEFAVAEGASLTSIWNQEPRVAQLDDGPKGEGIAYRADGRALMTISEGTPPSLFQTALDC